MRKNIYWFCFIRQLRELYALLAAEKLIDCAEDEYISHFTGKKFPEQAQRSAKINWYGGEETLIVMLEYLAEKGFVNINDVKVYGIIISGMSVQDMMKIHFKTGETREVHKKSFISRLEALFPASTSYRCKTRLFYKARNKQSISSVLESCGVV